MSTILKSITLENYRGHQSPATHIDNIGGMLMLVGKNDIGKSSILEALDAFFNTDEIKDTDYCQTNNATDLTIKCAIDSNVFELQSNKTSGPSYSKNGSPYPSRDALRLDFGNVHYNLFRADNTKVARYQNSSVAVLIDKIKKGKPYRDYCLNNHVDKQISNLVDNTINIADAFRKLRPFFTHLGMTYYNDLNDDKNFENLKRDKRTLLAKLRRFTFTNPDIERDKENLFQKLFDNNIYIADTRDTDIRVDRRYAHYDDFANWFINTQLENITETSIDRNIVHEYEEEQKHILKPLNEIENVIADFKVNSSPIEKRGSGVKRLCAFYQFAMKYKTSRSAYGDKYILAVEEPEISLHPSQQRKFIQQLLTISQNSDIQVIVTTHSPIIVKEMGANINSIKVLTQNGVENLTGNREKCIVHYDSSGKDDGYVSISEINYIAFDEPSIEYHIELFAYIQDRAQEVHISDFDTWLTHKTVDSSLRFDDNGTDDGFVNTSNKLVKKENCWTWVGGTKDGQKVDSTLPVCVRNNIDHPDSKSRNNIYNDKVERSIKLMRSVIKNDTTTFPIPII